MCKPFWKGSCRSVIFSRWLEAVTCSCCYCHLAMSQTLEPGLSSHGPRRGWSHGARHSETHRKSGRLLCSEEDSALASILRFYSLTRIRGVLKCVALFPNQSSASQLVFPVHSELRGGSVASAVSLKLCVRLVTLNGLGFHPGRLCPGLLSKCPIGDICLVK